MTVDEEPMPPAANAEPQPEADQLRSVPLFTRVDSPSLLADVAARMRLVSLAAGGTVFREGDMSTDFYLVRSGTVGVSTDLGGRVRQLARVGPGQFFGEIALLGGGRRSATVTATTDVELWVLSAQAFAQLQLSAPALAAQVATEAQQRKQHSKTLAYEVQRYHLADLLESRASLTLGRDASNTVTLESPQVSPFHAVIGRDGTGYTLTDLDSTTGTFVNGSRIHTAQLADGDELWIGDERLAYDAGQLAQVNESRGVRIDARGLCRDVKGGKRILHDIDLTILPGELVALVGGSGAGKSTLLDALSGVRPATSGGVLYDGRDYYANLPFYRKTLGYVPQDDIIHTDLPLRRTLLYAARLRLPLGTPRAELDTRVDAALEQLALTGQADVQVAKLSGGQRKRCSMGVELLTQPRAFFLDEPTSGLDPATDAQMMRLLRRIADVGDTVLVTTHATKSVMLCDKVVFLARGGHLAFVGPPARALAYFGTSSFDEIYDRLADEDTPEEWAERFRTSPDMDTVREQQVAQPTPTVGDTSGGGHRSPLPALREAFRQFRVLTARTTDISVHNPAVLMPLIVLPLVSTLLLLALFPSNVFSDKSHLSRPLQVILLLTFTTFLSGLLTGILAIVKELPIFLRERMVGVGVTPYLLSKATFLGPVVALQAAVMVGILRVTNRLPADGWSFYGPLLLTTVLVGLAAMAAALFTSAVSRTPQQATDFLSIWIMPQMLFSGALFAVPTMTIVGRLLADITVVRFAFEANAEHTGLLKLFRDSGTPAGQSLTSDYGSSFTIDRLTHWGILVVFIVVPLVAARVILAKRAQTR